MTASENIKTPAMEIPLLCIPNAKVEGERLKKNFTQVLLKDVRLCLAMGVVISTGMVSIGARYCGGVGDSGEG